MIQYFSVEFFIYLYLAIFIASKIFIKSTKEEKINISFQEKCLSTVYYTLSYFLGVYIGIEVCSYLLK